MNFYAGGGKISHRIAVGDAMFIADVMPSEAENGKNPEKSRVSE